MANIESVKVKGFSGKEYSMDCYSLASSWQVVSGVYVVGRREGNGNITALYVGETENLKQRFENHHKQICFNKNSANVLCWISENNASNRLAIETDIRRQLNPTCNDQ